MLLARRLVEGGCRFVTVSGYTHGAWDTHGDSDKTVRQKLAPLLNQSLSALLEDLHQRGLLESTVVIASGEFGRTPTINPNRGRDHWPDCWSLVLGGGEVKLVDMVAGYGVIANHGQSVGRATVSGQDVSGVGAGPVGLRQEAAAHCVTALQSSGPVSIQCK